uniref:Uncharacterized protein n=1 Tax=Panagrolaimus sp. ES5 TaxID=591445 RepID=A0AC34G281_9BILA
MPIVMVESVDDVEERRKTRTTKTAVSPESKTAKEKTKTKDDGEKKAPVKMQPSKPVQPPPPAILAAPRKPLPPRQLKYRCMYGEDGFTKMDELYDYHNNETIQFKETVVPAIFNEPDTRIHYNFWDCLKTIVETERDCQVFADRSNRSNSNVYFMVRDLVDRDGFYAPCLKLSNRVLECFDFNPRPHKPIYQPVDKEGNKIVKRDPFYMLRIFILSYDPLTIEIHCRGPWPFFYF